MPSSLGDQSVLWESGMQVSECRKLATLDTKGTLADFSILESIPVHFGHSGATIKVKGVSVESGRLSTLIVDLVVQLTRGECRNWPTFDTHC